MDNNYSGAIAVIPKGTVITGNIETKGRLEMYGEIRGNIISTDALNIEGDIFGDIHASEICMKEGFVKGKIEADNGVTIQQNTVVLGDVSAETLQIDGAVQGNLDIKGCVTIGETAIVDGDVSSKSIQIQNGAVISGRYSQVYAEVRPTEYFEEKESENNIKIGKGEKKKNK